MSILTGPDPVRTEETMPDLPKWELSHVGLFVTDMDRMRAFYTDVLGYKVMDAGELVSDAIVNAIVAERIAEPDCARGFILDGYPRTLAQADELETMLKKAGKPLDVVVELVVDDKALVGRIVKRAEDYSFERATLAWRNLVKMTRDECFPRAGFALDQYRGL